MPFTNFVVPFFLVIGSLRAWVTRMQFCELSMPPIHLHSRARKEPCLPLLCERMVGMRNFSFPSTFVCSAAKDCTLYQSHLSHLMSSVEYLVQCLLLASMTLFVWHCMHRCTLNVIQVMMTLMPLLTRR